ncbi:DinB family protein [Paenibacillus sp. GCM10023250]|uniref:DinB family protein n=1 Tax=Paenibacillus sp. GCM10023250 TaxID=3252648 RepID=UPI003621AB2F
METIKRMFDHLSWANERILGALCADRSGSAEAAGLFEHALRVEQAWHARLLGRDSAHVPIWSEDGVDACVELAANNKEAFASYLARLKPERLDDMIVYANQTGREFRTSIRDILTHVALHGQYHRGQVNAKLRRLGGEPVNVDYIAFVR